MSKVMKFFDYFLATNISVCKIENPDTQEECGTAFIGRKTSNLKLHVKRKHVEIYNKYLKNEILRRSRLGNSLSKRSKIRKMRRIDKYFLKRKRTVNYITAAVGMVTGSRLPFSATHEKWITIIGKINNQKTERRILININTYILSAVEMVTEGGLPLSTVDANWYRMLVDKIYKAFNINITGSNIGVYVHDFYEIVKSKVLNLIHNKLINVKVDCVTRRFRSFIAIHIQFVHQDKIKLLTISTKKIRRDEENLKNIIKQELENFGINLKQIYSVTFDNGANFIKTTEIIDDSIVREVYEYEEDVDVDMETDINIDQTVALFQSIQNIDWKENNPFIQTVRCPLDALQLAINDTLKINDPKTETFVSKINDARLLVEELRTKAALDLLKKWKQDTKLPIIDCRTRRWNFTYNMLIRLVIDLRPFCSKYENEIPKLSLPDDTWKMLEEIIQGLKICVSAILKLQAPDITITDAYMFYDTCQIQINEIDSEFARELCKNLQRRREIVFNNSTFYAALFMDPRVKCVLNDEERTEAIRHLSLIYKKMQCMRHNANRKKSEPDIEIDDPSCSTEMDAEVEIVAVKSEPGMETDDSLCSAETETEPDVEIIDDPSCSTEPEPEIEIVVKSKPGMEIDDPSNEEFDERMLQQRRFDIKLESFNNEVHQIDVENKILEFWSSKKFTDPELYSVANVILSVSTTQASVEKLFLNTDYMLNPSTMKQNNGLNEILFLRANFQNLKNIDL